MVLHFKILKIRNIALAVLALLQVFLFSISSASANESCKEGQFLNDKGVKTDWRCGCGKPSGVSWADVGNGCFHKMVCSTGDFINTQGEKVLYSCGCDDQDLTGWSQLKTGCFHKVDKGGNPNPNPISSGETTIETAKNIPTGALFKSSKFAGVFDPRNTNEGDFKIVNSQKTLLTGVGKCLVSNQEIGFSFLAKGQSEVLEYFKIPANNTAFIKVIIPPGVSNVELKMVSSNWGNALTSIVASGKTPVESEGLTQGRFSSLNFGSDINKKESYVTGWIYNKNPKDSVAVNLVTVIYKIGDYNLYNQWYSRTTSQTCAGAPVPLEPTVPGGNYTFDEIIPDVFSPFVKLRPGQHSIANAHDDPRTGTISLPFPPRWNTITPGQSVRLKILIPPGVSLVGWYLQAPDLVADLGVCNSNQCVTGKGYPPTIFPFGYNSMASGAEMIENLPALTGPAVGYIIVNALSVNFTFFGLYVNYTIKDPQAYEAWRLQRNWAGGAGDCDGLGGVFCR